MIKNIIYNVLYMSSNTLKETINMYIEQIRIKMNEKDMKLLFKINKDEYERRMYEYVPIFSEKYPVLFNYVINNEDLGMLDLFLNRLDDVQSGKKEMYDVRMELGNELHNKYVKKNIK